MEFDTPIPFEEALEKLRARDIMPTPMSSAELRKLHVMIREDSFFSSKVESARVLQAMKDYSEDFLAGVRLPDGSLKAQGRAEFVANMRELAIREGLGKVDTETGRIDPEIRESDLTDIRSLARPQLALDTVTESAQEYGYFTQGQDPAILHVFPAQRFIRVRPVENPRPYHAANEGVIRRKDDLPFWVSMNRDFGVPWGPWGFNSGMGVEDVDRDEAIAAGVIKERDEVTPLATQREATSAGVRDLSTAILAALTRATGGTVAEGRLYPKHAEKNA